MGFLFLSNSISTCLAELVAHLGVAFLFLTWLGSHSGLLGLSGTLGVNGVKVNRVKQYLKDNSMTVYHLK